VASDSHWTGYGIALAAQDVVRAVRREKWLGAVPRQMMATGWHALEHSGSIFRDLTSKGGLPARLPERVHYRSVRLVTPEGPKSIGRSAPDSPVVIMGDSNTIWWGDRSGVQLTAFRCCARPLDSRLSG
jgi:hypothetical protein